MPRAGEPDDAAAEQRMRPFALDYDDQTWRKNMRPAFNKTGRCAMQNDCPVLSARHRALHRKSYSPDRKSYRARSFPSVNFSFTDPHRQKELAGWLLEGTSGAIPSDQQLLRNLRGGGARSSTRRRKSGGAKAMQARDAAHWKATSRLMFIHLGVWVFFGYVVHMFVNVLNNVVVIGFPLGFYMAAQGSLIAFVVMLFIFAKQQDKIDRDHGVAEED
jgi:putative solute:sodium symporter small subunit